MLSTVNVLPSIQDVPSSWIFQNYCRIAETLSGQEIKITSIFKPQEKTPSMTIYCTADGKYKFNDFSTGKKGDGIDLVSYYFGLDNRNSTIKILNEYSQFKLNNGSIIPLITPPAAKFKVTESTSRHWNNDDVRFFTSFHIGSKCLALYEVRPLSSYTMIKEDVSGPQKIVINKPYCYGYFKKDGTLYKIYQPYNKERKFLKVINGYVQGDEQRTKTNPFLLLTSSLKDTMCIHSLGIKKIDFESPDSENTKLDAVYIESRQSEYKKIICLFDNDSAGIDAMKFYKKEYNIDFVYFNMAKDPSDAVKKFGAIPVRDDLVIKINTKLNT
jgi:hypothetical protein